MKFKIGDKVLLKHNNYAQGIIVDIDNQDNTYKIRLDGTNSGFAWSNEAGLFVPEEPKCQCGLKYSRHGGKHSRWCSASEGQD